MKRESHSLELSARVRMSVFSDAEIAYLQSKTMVPTGEYRH